MSPPVPNPQPPQPTQVDKTALLTALRKPLKDLVDNEIDRDCDQEKVVQYRMMRRNHLYFEGKQNIAPQWISPGFADFGSDGAPVASPASMLGQGGQFDYPFNIIRGDALKGISVMGKAPKVKGVADDPESEEGEQQAELSDTVAEFLRSEWNPDQKTRETGLILWIYSPAYAYTRYRADGSKYGYTQADVMAEQQMPLGPGRYACPTCAESTEGDEGSIANCPTCGTGLTGQNFIPPDTIPVPQKVGENTYENGTCELEIFSGLEVSHSFYSEKKKDLEYLKLERDFPKGKLVAMYTALKSKIDSEPGSGPSAGEQAGVEARGVVTSPTGVRYPHVNLWRYELVWVKSSLYPLIKGQMKDENGQGGKFGDLMMQQFPNGARLDFVNGELQDVVAEDLCDVWEICKPGISKKIIEDPICTDEIPVQDMYNDLLNLMEENIQRQVPATLVSNELINVDAMKNRGPIPGEMIVCNPGIQDIKGQMAPLPMSSMSPESLPFINSVREFGRENIGVNKMISGASDSTEKTAKQALIEKQQALMQLSIPYDNIRQFWEGCTLNGVRQIARYGTGQIRIASKEGLLGMYSRTADIAQLKEKGYHFEADEGMPESNAEQRDTVKDLMMNAPPVATAVGFDSPYNAAKLQQFFGVPGMFSPVEIAREKVRAGVADLLKGKPVNVDPWDDSVIMSDLLRIWLISSEGRSQQATNPNFQAVVNWWAQHKQASMPPPPPPGAPPPGPPPGIGKPKPKPNGQPAAGNTNTPPPPQMPAPGNASPVSQPLPIQ